MASNDDMIVDGTPISDLRVVDLKEQLEKRGLSKSGSKTVLVKRLKDHLSLEKLQEAQVGKDPNEAPNMEMRTCGNNLVAEYLEQQQQMLQAAKMAAARSVAASSESSASPVSSAVSTPAATPDADGRLASPPLSSPTKRSRSNRSKSPRQSLSDLEANETAYYTPGTTKTADTTAAFGTPIADYSAATPIVEKPDIVAVNLLPILEREAAEKETTPMPSDENIGAVETRSAENAIQQKTVGAQFISTEVEQVVITEVKETVVSEETSDQPITVTTVTTVTETREVDVMVKDIPAAVDQPESEIVQGVDTSPQDSGDVERLEKASSPSGDGGNSSNSDDDRSHGRFGQRGNDDAATATKSKIEEPMDDPDEVEMEISAPANAADELLEAVNTAPAKAVSGKKASEEREEPRSRPIDKENQDIPQRKRKWVAAKMSKRTAVSISTDSLKDIVASVKDTVQEEEPPVDEEFEEIAPAPKRIVISRDVVDDEMRTSTDKEPVRRVEIDTRPTTHLTEDGLVRVGSPSPARHPPSNILHIRGLTRPFTVPQLHELLSTYGDFSKEEFWIDNIKSHCIVKYNDEASAVLARDRLHNVQWPQAQPKMLRVDFASQEDLDRHRTTEAPAARISRASADAERISADRPTREVREIRKMDKDELGRKPASPRGTEVSRDDRSWDRGKKWRAGESPPTDPRGAGARKRSSASPDRRGVDVKRDQTAQPAKLLDELFRKTKATPCIYWLPLSAEQVREKERERKKREQERQERLRKLDEEDRERRRSAYPRRSPPPMDYRSRHR